MGKSISSTNNADLTESIRVEECKQIPIKTQVLLDQKPEHKPDTQILMGQKVGNNLEFISIGEDFLSRIWLAQKLM